MRREQAVQVVDTLHRHPWLAEERIGAKKVTVSTDLVLLLSGDDWGPAEYSDAEEPGIPPACPWIASKLAHSPQRADLREESVETRGALLSANLRQATSIDLKVGTARGGPVVEARNFARLHRNGAVPQDVKNRPRDP